MIDQVNRIGRFTSSEIYKLMSVGSRPMTPDELAAHKKENPKSYKKNIDDGFGESALTYIEEKRAERSLGRSIDTGATSNEMIWGHVMEAYAFEYCMGMEYKSASKKALLHPKYNFWAGSPDFEKPKTGGEMKCFYPKKFYTLSKELIKLNDGLITLDDFKNNTKSKLNEIFYQVLSNTVILGHSRCEIMAFTPTEEQLIHVIDLLEDTDFAEKIGLNPWNVRFIVERREKLYELPYIPKHSNWPNMVSHEFDLPIDDVIALTKAVIAAEKELNNG